MKGKKSLFTLLFLFIFSISCFGLNDFKIIKTPDVDLKTTFTMPIQKSLRNEAPSVSTRIKLDFYSFNAAASFNVTVNSLDTVLSVLTIPFSFNLFEVGVGAKYHLYDYFDSFLENDFLLNQYFAFLYKDIIRLQINTGYSLKYTLFKFNKFIEPVFYQTIYLGLDFIWNITKYIQLYAGANSMSDYDFSLIGTPFYNLGFNFNLKENLMVGFNYEIKMIDMVAVAETFSEMLLSIYMEVSL